MRSSIAPGPRAIRGQGGGSIAALWLAAALLGAPLSGHFGLANAQSPAPPAAPGALVPDSEGSSLLPPAGQAQQSDPRRAATAAAQAVRLMNEGKTDDALKVLDVALADAPRDPRLRFLYGVILAERGRSRDATDVFEQMTRDFPELPEPYNNLAVMYAAAGDLDRARAALENSVRALPGYALAHENLGDVYVRMAARAYERAADLEPRGTTAREKLTLARELMKAIAPRPAATRP